ncbi:uncharacterized protein [Macrobrachium rosenbergii]|uniref:uncharacterized protein n=1 Tax=Macrobrachium rosenbergii TaxID=79674 RepID=UPI0034D764C3
MAGRRHYFRGQIGINETPLTIAIGNGDYQLAEDIIEATSDVTFLNDGPCENVPLHMVLTNNYNSCLKRNLKLAKILVQKGANPNLRIPFIDFDRISPSPFEELVVCYEALRYFVNGRYDALSDEIAMYVGEDDILMVFVNDTIDLDGNTCMPTMLDCEKLIKQTSELINIFLENGGDPNVITTFRHKTLFHWIVEHDLDLGKRFLKTCRVNINLRDAHGNSPIMDAILSNDAEDVVCLYTTMCEMVDSVDINSLNCIGETALFRSCLVGAVELALKLCDDGAKIDSAIYVNQFPVSFPPECGYCADFLFCLLCCLPSPLLAPLLIDSSVRIRYARVTTYESCDSNSPPHKHLTDKIILSSISPLIDYFYLKCQSPDCDPTFVTTLLDQLLSLMEYSSFNHLRNGQIPSLDLVSLMFGQLSAGLRQLCVRTIFDHVLMVSQIPKKSWPQVNVHDFCLKKCERALMVSHTAELVEMLQLPHSFKIFFDIEAAKYQLCRIIMGYQCLECQQACSESDLSMNDEEFSTDSSDVSSDNGSSILIHSSDILSDESLEEVDDLSDEFSDSEEDDDDEVSETSKGASDEVRVRRKIRCDYESLSSSSENIRVIVETLCEDVAENMAQQQHKSECQGHYQRLNGKCSNSPTSSNCTSPSSSSESEVKVSAKESSDSP